MDTKNILVPLAKGFEEVELISVVDILRRAKACVVLASLGQDLLVEGSHNIKLQADTTLEKVDISTLHAIALAGGYEGMQNLAHSNAILEIIKTLHTQGKLVTAICASPIVLDKAGVINGNFTCYPGCETGISGNYLREAVVQNHNVITSAAPATAMLFALSIVKELFGVETYNKLYNELQMPLVCNP